MNRRRLSASAMDLFLRSPKAFYFRYVRNIEPVATAPAPDALAGSLFADFTDRFYKGVPEPLNTPRMMREWAEQTENVIPERQRAGLTAALESWANMYYQMFSPDDGARNGSEKLVENDRFIGYVDGLSHDKVLLELKTTSRAKALSEQIWMFQRSLQVKLYCVLTEAIGIRIEMCFKDQPHAIHRADVIDVTPEQRKQWELELNSLADTIVGLGDNPDNYPCHPKGCCIFSKNWTSPCAYQALCEMGYNDTTAIGYQPRNKGR